MIGRGDGTITVAWDKPSDPDLEDPRLHDHLDRRGPVVVDGGTTSFPAPG